MADLAFRVRAPLGLALSDGSHVTISEWSLEGVHFPDELDVFPKEAMLSIPFQGVDITFPVRLNRDADSRFLTFDGLSGRQRETLAVFYRSLLSGRMASTDEIITSLDTPVDLVPMGETEEEKTTGTTGKSPRAFRAMLNVAIYTLLGAVVFWTLGAGVYAKVSGVTIDNARIEAVLTDYVAADQSYVKSVEVNLGDPVARGAVLVRLTTPDGEAALSEVRGRITLIEDRLAQARMRRAQALERWTAAREVMLRRVTASPDETAILALEIIAAFDAGLASDSGALLDLLNAADREVRTLEDDLRRLRRDRGRLRAANDALHVIAADDGIVRDIHVMKGQVVGRGAPVVQVEAMEARHARGWADHSMAQAFHIGMEVRATLNTAQGKQTLRGRVSDLVAGVDPDLSPDFGLLVSVSFPEKSAAQSRQTLPHLMPVDLKAKRGWAQSLTRRWERLRGKIGG